MNGETGTFADIFIETDRNFTTTYTTIFSVKKINIVHNFTMNFMRFNVYGGISSSGHV